MDNQRRADVGISISQSGSPVDMAPDYKKVLDSRWRFLEVAYEVDFPLRLPARAPDAGTTQRQTTRVNVLRHNLKFTPGFESGTLNYIIFDPGAYELYTFSDDEFIYIEASYYPPDGARALSTTIPIRVYNLPVLEEYEAPKELVAGSSSEQGDVGVKVLDGSDRSVRVGDDYPVGFSVDTTKKILSIHKHGVKDINRTLMSDLNMVSANASTDVITYTVRSGYTSWLETPGSEVSFLAVTGLGGALPGGLSESNRYYTIPVSSNSFKVATTRENALNGVAVNITSAGSTPVNIYHRQQVTDDLIVHDVGYPPTYLLARVDEIDGKRRAHPFKETLYIVFANSRTIRIQGVQAQPQGLWAYVILKDPAEIVG